MQGFMVDGKNYVFYSEYNQKWLETSEQESHDVIYLNKVLCRLLLEKEWIVQGKSDHIEVQIYI